MSEEQITETPESTLVGEPAPSTDWRSGLSEDLASHSAIKDIASIEDLAKSAIHAQQMVGADKIAVPGKDADAQAWEDVYNKLGRPEKAGDYELPQENVPSLEDQGAQLEEFKGEAHRLGLNKQQFAGLVRFMAEKGQQGSEAAQANMTEMQKQAVATLQQEFGAAYDQNLNLAKSAVEQFGGEELKAVLNQTGLGNNPELVKAFARIGKMVASDEIIGKGGRESFVMSPGEAQEAIMQKKLDVEFMAAYTQNHHPGHMAAVEEMQNLFELANPEE